MDISLSPVGDDALDLLTNVSHSLMVATREGADIRVQIGLLCLLCTWLYEFPKGVTSFLSESANLQFVSYLPEKRTCFQVCSSRT
jgi:hypothetical protein